MPRAYRKKMKIGRAIKLIDWKRVDELLLAGCHGTEIAPHFDMHVQTFYDRVSLEKGMSFTEYSTKKQKHGDSIIREVQFNKALKGDNVLLIWLGKNRLTQREIPIEVSPLAPNQNAIDKDDIIIRLTSELAEIKKLLAANADK